MITVAQIAAAYRLAREHNHRWACVLGLEEVLAIASEHPTAREALAAIRAAVQAANPGPDWCPGIHAPHVDHVGHITHTSTTGRTWWSITQDGAVNVIICRPTGAVLHWHLAPDGRHRLFIPGDRDWVCERHAFALRVCMQALGHPPPGRDDLDTLPDAQEWGVYYEAIDKEG